MDVERLTREARWVVEADVMDARSDWSPDRSQIYTYVTLRLGQRLKGTWGPATLRLRLLGGVADGIAMILPEAPVLAPGERAILFLGPNPQTLFPTVGLAQGVFRIARDSKTGEETATNAFGLSFPKPTLERAVRSAIAREQGMAP
jgi:hypothetical protein